MLKFKVFLCLIAFKVGCGFALEQFVKGNEKFAIKLVKLLTKHDKGAISPLSAELVLALTTEGAEGETYEELKKVLHLPDKKTTREAANQLHPILNNCTEDFTVSLANRLYIQDTYEVNKDFKKVAVDDFHSGVKKVDFGDNEKVAKSINYWVESKTNNKIKNLVNPNQINEDTSLVLINTLYLKGQWETPFPTEKTKKGVFYGANDKTHTVDFMHSADHAEYLYHYCGKLKAKFLEIPYKDSSICALFILPDDRDGLEHLEENLELYLQPKNSTRHRVNVCLPKFSETISHDFKKILVTLGASKLFKADEADLSGISNVKGLHVNFIQQKIVINMTELGTEAAAATAVGGSTTSVVEPPNHVFHANHPFFYVIKELKSNVILFGGRYR